MSIRTVNHGPSATPPNPASTPRADSANKSTESSCVYQADAHSNTAELTQSLTRATRSNGISRAKASQQIESKSLPVASSIRQPSTRGLTRQPTLRSGTIAATPSGMQERAQTRGLVNELLSILDAKTDDKSGKPLSDSIRFQKSSSGQVLMFKQTKENNTIDNQRKYMDSSSGKAARETAGEKLTALLQGAGLEIDDNNRIALPNADRPGDAATLRQVLDQALHKLDAADSSEKMQAVVSELRKEIVGIDLKDESKSKLFMRGNSEAAKLAGKFLEGSFKNDVESIVSKMNQSFTEGIKAAGPNPDRATVDKALVATYQALLKSLANIKLSDEFRQLAREIGQIVDDAATAQSAGLAGPSLETLQKNAQACKLNIVPALLLRSLTTELTLDLNNSESPIFNKVANVGNTSYPIRMSQMTSNLISKINSGKTEKLSSMHNMFPEFKNFTLSPENNIDQFTAMKQLMDEL